MIPDWMRCIICYVFARDGVITHKKGCVEYRRPNPATATRVRIGDLLPGRRP